MAQSRYPSAELQECFEMMQAGQVWGWHVPSLQAWPGQGLVHSLFAFPHHVSPFCMAFC